MLRRGGLSLLVALVVGAGLAVAVDGPSAPAAAAPTACDRLAWSGFDGSDRELYVSGADGTSRVPITSSTADDVVPQWSPDRTQIAWLAGVDDDYSLMVADGLASSSSIVTIADGAAYIDPFHEAPPRWSSDGERVIWARQDIAWWDQRVWITPADGAHVVEVTSPAAGYSMTYGEPTWIPRTERVVFSGEAGSSDREIIVADADGSNSVVISSGGAGFDPQGSESPVVSPDGTKIAWVGRDGNGGTYIFVANIDGSGRTRLTTTTSQTNQDPAWSPDSSRIAWSRNGEIVVADPDGLNFVAISSVGVGSDPSSNETPVWSPDGSRIAWAGQSSSMFEIFASNPDGTDRVEISTVSPGTDPTDNRFPTWAPTGQIAFVDERADIEHGVVDEVVVRVQTPCTVTAVEIAVASPPCFAGSIASVTTGSYAAGLWTIPALVGEASITFQGTATGTGDCAFPATVTAATGAAPGATTIAGDPCVHPDHPFEDVGVSSFAYAPVGCIFELDITNGTSSTTYSPTGDVTREQMAAFLARIWRGLGNPCTDEPHPFVDVTESSFAFDDVACIFELGITNGTSATEYSPDGLVTREQMAAFLARLWRAAGGSCVSYPYPLSDVPRTSFAFDDVGCIFELGITNGTSATTYSPGLSVTRAQMAAFLERLWVAVAANG